MVSLIRKSGDLVALTVVTVTPTTQEAAMQVAESAAVQGRQYSTLPRKLQGRSMIQPPPPPKRDPSTTLSVGRAKARSMVANLAAIGKSVSDRNLENRSKRRNRFAEVLDRAISEHDNGQKGSGDGPSSLQSTPIISQKNSSPHRITALVHEKFLWSGIA